jgi:hypothetical protein
VQNATRRGSADGYGVLSAQNIASVHYPITCFEVEVVLTAIDRTTLGNILVWKMPFGVLYTFYGTGSLTYVGTTPLVQSLGTGSSATVSVSADTTYGGLDVSFTAPNSDTWHVVAKISFVEVS